MPSLEPYHKGLDYSYAPGLFPCMEAINKRPDLVRRVLVSSKLSDTDASADLYTLCREHNIRIEMADRMLSRLSSKENVFAAAVFHKAEGELSAHEKHIVLHHPGDKGNIGTIMRTALGFGFTNIAIIRPAADYYDPRVVRSSMGALFSLNMKGFDSFDSYRAEHPNHDLFPFMLTGAISPQEAVQQIKSPYSLVMGNEGSGLPHEFASMGQAVRIPHSDDIDSLNLSIAAAVGMYIFAHQGS